MSTSSPVAPAEPNRVLLTPSRLTLTSDDCADTMQLAATWRGSNVSITSPIDSPLVRRAAVNLLLGVPSANDSVSSWSLDDQTTTDDSSHTTPLRSHSPGPSLASRHGSKRYRNELWSAIKSDYLYLMDEEIIDACKSTESEISSDEMSSETKVSYNEFLQQYKELTEWLGHIQLIVRQQAASRSENYLTHMYHEEMLKQSPRQQLFNDYARQLMRRYPQLKQEIVSRLNHVNEQWTEVMNGLVLPPGVGCHDTSTMLFDIREDVRALREWVSEMEKSLASLHILMSWSTDNLREKLVEHQDVQKDIESRSRIVSAVLKLCAWLKVAQSAGEGGMISVEGAMEDERAAVQADAESVEQRWHSVWIQSVEWQLRLEEAISGRNHRLRSLSYSDDEKMDLMRMSLPPSGDVESPEFRGNISAVAVTAESLEDSDIIPFHDSEYEEIGENDLMFSYAVDSDADENSCKSTIEKNPEPLLSESMEAGLDSALGRSVSNPSLHIDNRCLMPTLHVNDTGPIVQLSHTSGAHDFGYSSEGHSNEEPENAVAGRSLPIGGIAVGKGLDEESTWDNVVLDSAGTSGIGTNVVQRSRLCHTTDTSFSVSAASSLMDSHLQSSIYREPVGAETDDDFTSLNELPLDDAPSASELDLLAKLATASDDNRQSLMRVQGRSLDSLAPLGSDRLYSVEKRVSSVEIIVDSVASSSRPSITSQLSQESGAEESVPGEVKNNTLLLPSSCDGHRFSAVSSCDASSEGTLSDSEFSDLGSSDGIGSPKKSRPLTKRVRRLVRTGPPKSCSSTSMKSPTKRRMENLLEIPTVVCHMTRSTSHGAIDVIQRQDCSGVKRSRICQSLSDLLDGQSLKKATTSRGYRSDFVVPRKVSLHRSAHKLNFDLKDAAVLEMGGSLTSVTWDEDIVGVFDNNRVDMAEKVDIASDDWCNSSTFTDEFSMSHAQPQQHTVGTIQKRTSRSALHSSKQSWPDSDSDTEDFLNIVLESRKAFIFTQSTLEQFRQDHVEGTVIHEPAEYMGAIATCQTNITCLLELVDAMQFGTNVDVADGKIQQITDIVRHWRTLEELAVSQQHDCQQLYALHLDRVRIERDLESLKHSFSFDKFDDIHALEMTLRAIQAGCAELSTTVSEQLTSLRHRLDQFQQENQNVNVTRLSAAIDVLEQSAYDLAECGPTVESRLKEAVMTWYQLNEMQRNLEQVIAQEQHQLDCLDVAADVVSLSASDVDDTIADLQMMSACCATHQDKLRLMESLCCKLEDTCSSEMLSDVREGVCAATDDLRCLQRKCSQIIERLHNHHQSVGANSHKQLSADAADNNSLDEIDALDTALFELQPAPDAGECEGMLQQQDLPQVNKVLTPAELKVDNITCVTSPDQLMEKLAADVVKPEMKPSAVKAGVSSSLLRRLLRYSLPLPLLLLILFGGLYLLCDQWNEALNDLGLIISPQLKHVRGSPPV